jgi:RNA polymerase sigma-70 factor (ECF subfamily)
MIGNNSTLMKRLVTEARQGSVPALDQLLRVLYPQFLRLAKYSIRSDDAAKDVVQETLMRLSENLLNLRNPDAFNRWAHVILKSCCVSYFRQKKRLRSFEADIENFGETACVPNSEESEFCAPGDLAAAIDSLGSKSQEVVRMHYFFGLSVKEIAARVRVSDGAVKVRLHRARNELKERLIVRHGDLRYE